MRTKLLLTLFALVTTASLASAALESVSPRGCGTPGNPSAQDRWLAFDQPPDSSGWGLSSQIDYVYPFDSGAVDDFVVNPAGLFLNRIDWWGAYWNYPSVPGSVDSWVITIYRDGGYCYPGAVYATPSVTWFTETYDGAMYEVSAFIPGVYLPPGRYWLEIQGIMVFEEEGQWGWVVSATEEGDCGAPLQGFPLLGIPYWTAQPEYAGMAFRLYQVWVATEDTAFSSIKALY